MWLLAAILIPLIASYPDVFLRFTHDLPPALHVESTL